MDQNEKLFNILQQRGFMFVATSKNIGHCVWEIHRFSTLSFIMEIVKFLSVTGIDWVSLIFLPQHLIGYHMFYVGTLMKEDLIRYIHEKVKWKD